MNKRVLFVAVHPDDETLGCGGAILRHKAADDSVSWLILTRGYEKDGFDKELIDARKKEIEKVVKAYGFDQVHELGLPTTLLDTIPLRDIIGSIGGLIQETKPNILFIPNYGDVHSDHRVAFDALWSCTRRFRFSSVREVYAYETISETEFAPPLGERAFLPNTFYDISKHLRKKLDILEIYKNETAAHPFPRSRENLEALAKFRGATIGVKYAEAFMCLKRVVK